MAKIEDLLPILILLIGSRPSAPPIETVERVESAEKSTISHKDVEALMREAKKYGERIVKVEKTPSEAKIVTKKGSIKQERFVRIEGNKKVYGVRPVVAKMSEILDKISAWDVVVDIDRESKLIVVKDVGAFRKMLEKKFGQVDWEGWSVIPVSQYAKHKTEIARVRRASRMGGGLVRTGGRSYILKRREKTIVVKNHYKVPAIVHIERKVCGVAHGKVIGNILHEKPAILMPGQEYRTTVMLDSYYDPDTGAPLCESYIKAWLEPKR